MWRAIYQRLLQAHSQDEDSRRRELILNILAFCVILLSGLTLLWALIGALTHAAAYSGASWVILLAMFSVFVTIYFVSRAGYAQIGAYVFITMLFVFSTYPFVVWGVQFPQALLMYALLIVITGVLNTSRATLRITVLMTLTLLIIKHFEATGAIHFNTTWMQNTGSYNVVLAYGIVFSFIALVSTLSNREIVRSLQRARESEEALKEERNLLEIKVLERTRALEKAQVEKMLELHRFAEFGRFSSTLLHELTNPLTAVSLNLEQLASKSHSNIIQQARQGITFMENYVEAARRQLRNESEIREFDVGEEIERVLRLLEPKAHKHRVTIDTAKEEGLKIRGDSIRFNQVVANLVANAIDAYNDVERTKKVIKIHSLLQSGHVAVQVEDKGIGIAPDDLEHIFEPFFTSKAVQRGTGLGLTITKQIVEQDFGGHIEVESAPRAGTCFVLKFPIT